MQAAKLWITMLFLISLPYVQASESRINENVKGLWFGPNEIDNLGHQLKASWIWEDEKLNAKAIFARKTFSVSEGVEKVILRITASTQYQLYVNGEYVCRGPARSAPHHQSYDILDISGLIKTGENLVAVRMHHQDGKRSYQYEGRAGFLSEITITNGMTTGIIPSNSSWKVIQDLSWDDRAPLISRYHQVVNDRVDFRKYLKGWETLSFDDSHWNDATELMRRHGWPAPQKNAKAQPLTPPWTSLVARDIPYLVEDDLKAEKLIEAVKISTPITKRSHSLSGKVNLKPDTEGELIIPASGAESWLLIYDFGEVINGMPSLSIEGKEGTEIEIISAPFMVDGKFTHITVDSEFRDKIILSGERDNWEATYFKPARYLGIIVNNEDPVTIYSAGIHQIKYPFVKRGQIYSKDAPWIKDYFDATAKTINVCTTDAYTDNYRERRQYAQTNYYAALGNYYIFGDMELQRRYLVQVAQEQLANGIMPAYAPAEGSDYMIILDSNCLWLRGLRNYLMYSGDEKTVKELLPAAQKLIELLHSFTFDLYFLVSPPYAYWLDHSVNDRRGVNLCLNGHYLGALTDYAEVLNHFGMDTKELEYQIEGAKLSYIHFWNEDKQLFADAIIDKKPSEMYSEHANAMALSHNNVWKEEAAKAAKQLLVADNHDYMKRESGITMVTPAMSYFLHKGLCNYGFVEESFDLFRKRFDMMLDKNTNQTLWEEWWLDGTGRTGKFQGGRTRSDAQTESAFPPALFAEFIVGIVPTKPGAKEWSLKNIQSGIKHVKSVIPSVLGDIEIEWEREGERKQLKISVPKGVKVNVDLMSLRIEKEEGIQCNNEPVDLKVKTLPLHQGNYLISF